MEKQISIVRFDYARLEKYYAISEFYIHPINGSASVARKFSVFSFHRKSMDNARAV